MVPIDDRHSVLDWMTLLRIPVILVAGTYVGTVSHTLTALEVLVRRNLNVAAVVISESQGSAASLEDTIVTVERFAGVIDVVGIPRRACRRGRASGLRAPRGADLTLRLLKAPGWWSRWCRGFRGRGAPSGRP